MEKSVFHFASYKSAMKHYFRAKGTRGLLSRAAEGIQCQRSYLSRVMDTKVHLTPDQAFALAQFLRLGPSEREYFQTLNEWERAGLPAYRETLHAKLRRLKAAHESIAERMQRPQPKTDFELTYFSGWQWCAIHLLTSLPTRQSPEAIAQRLSLPPALVQTHLEKLQEWGLVRKAVAGWEYASGEAHLPKDSPLALMHNQNWRTRAVLSSQSPNEFNVHFTNVQTISRADAELVKERLLQFISECNSTMGPSDPEVPVAFTCDFFRIDESSR